MAALIDANPKPDNLDDLTDSTPGPGQSDSGADVYGSFSMTPWTSHSTTPGVFTETGEGGGGAPPPTDGEGSTGSGPLGIWGAVEG